MESLCIDTKTGVKYTSLCAWGTEESAKNAREELLTTLMARAQSDLSVVDAAFDFDARMESVPAEEAQAYLRTVRPPRQAQWQRGRWGHQQHPRSGGGGDQASPSAAPPAEAAQ